MRYRGGVNILLQSRHTQFPPALSRLLEHRLLALGEAWRADEAVVRLSDQREASPRYQASIFLRVPGPDLHASGCDHTPGVAVRKALQSLEAQLAARAGRREQRRRSNLQHSSGSRLGRSW